MTKLAFVASVISSIAWPATFFVLALLFRPQIITNLGRLIKAKLFGTEWEFTEGLKKAIELSPPVIAKQDASLPLPSQTATATTADLETTEEKNNSWLKINKNDPPEYRVISAWNWLCSMIVGAGFRTDHMRVPKMPNQRAYKYVIGNIGLHPEEIEQINELEKLRNTAVDAPRGIVSTDDAERYEELVSNLGVRLTEIGRKEN